MQRLNYMVDSEQVRSIVNILFFNEKGFAYQKELYNDSYQWKEILDFVEEQVFPLGITIKEFIHDDQKCYGIMGPNEYTTGLSDKEAYLLTDFIIRFEIINPDKNGLDKLKWKEITIENLGKSRNTFKKVLDNLKIKGFLKEKSGIIQPSWRYKAFLNIEEILNEIKTDAKLAYLINPKDDEKDIID